jgi:hypothetical protein
LLQNLSKDRAVIALKIESVSQQSSAFREKEEHLGRGEMCSMNLVSMTVLVFLIGRAETWHRTRTPWGKALGRLVGIEPAWADETKHLAENKILKMQEIQPVTIP